ncbi:unnamed protein product [Kuraishia capsulata CBS 1993]|uniref:chitin synthase n=1 Tax=Kuraishia capsulata CBS 1993 TaxID=1382522 RepID=W6MGC8_9ASCO|nr:uncharacterized protein KUCA_T00001086001 [Kuraishia capsulata CBS 1993]CDK25119.1 unnamed protein product [Kuraishia capsulata CBS 1993]
MDEESGGANFQRKRSLVRNERRRLDPDAPNYHYEKLVLQESDHLKVFPSETGVDPTSFNRVNSRRSKRTVESIVEHDGNEDGIAMDDMTPPEIQEIKSGQEMYGLNDEIEASHLKSAQPKPTHKDLNDDGMLQPIWNAYCYVITFWAPAPLLALFGLGTKERQFAWREKIALISIIMYLGAFVAYITFGFTKTVCSRAKISLQNDDISTGYLVVNGRAYNLESSSHPKAAGVPSAANVLYPPVNAGGKDASFLFQNVNGNCKGIITPRDNCTIPHDGEELAWYMPCRLFELDGSSSPNFTESYYNGWACHTSTKARTAFYDDLKATGDVFFTWDQIKNSSRNLVVYSGYVLDMDLINWIQSDDVEYPDLFDRMRDDETLKGHDISMLLSESSDRKAARCLVETIKVGVIDSKTIGCIASQVVLYISLVFVLIIVIIKFVVACYFKWSVAPKQGASYVDIKTMAERDNKMENWADGAEREAQSVMPVVAVEERAQHHAKRSSQMLKRGSRLSWGGSIDIFATNEFLDPTSSAVDPKDYNPKYVTMSTQAAKAAKMKDRQGMRGSNMAFKRSSSYLDFAGPFENASVIGGSEYMNATTLSADIVHPDVVPQPPVSYEPWGYPLMHTMCLVTCYSEDEESIRLTMDSVATTEYPNSHKLIVVICDGLIKGAGNDRTTPEIALGLMTDLVIPEEEVQPYSYVSVVQGSKRHNMAKLYAGFYKYDDSTIPPEKQQRIPVITIVKCGTPAEAGASKPGNRGKRDSQIVLMSFLQRVTFDERMTELEFEMMKSIWSVTGIMPEMYEAVLMVDADTKVFPDCLTHMAAEFVKHPDIMGLCGETKIANKAQSWVTAIQVFEYYISHHQSKAFESVFGTVTCLPGCFCMYRIKAPKGSDGFWVPILANPDIVERYSENVLDTLHKKNLLLLGEDRYLSSLMLRTFPKRKQVFVPKAICKTVAPDKFKVLLSQRRRWINSTVHNLMELVLVKDLCGTFCFSMQFVILIELVGTMVLPCAICFTFYVIIFAIVSSPTPVMSLVLLGVIFGLPGLLIVVTTSSLMYIVWMLIYLLALPIWNFVLPTYAYWKFDDFSWGDTRKTHGGDKGGHDKTEGEFDGSQIVQKRWREYERDRKNETSPRNGFSAAYQPGTEFDDSVLQAEMDKNFVDMSYENADYTPTRRGPSPGSQLLLP